MIITCTLLLTVTCSALAVPSSEFALKGDPCSKFDSCFSKPLSPRTCSCDSGCEVYGTCCQDLKKKEDVAAADAKSYQCFDRRLTTPVFAKRSCSDDFKGHVGYRDACHDDDVDMMDVKNNLLVTSHKTKTTYWNKHCAVCNNEASADLEYWNIEVYCPVKEKVDKNLIRRNLTFDQDENEWGLYVDGEFLRCIVKYAPPPYIDDVTHCTPKLISTCPSDYSDRDIVAKCLQYYAERKHKNTETYYRNVHCAVCNGVDVKELECPGMFGLENSIEESDFREMVEETFVKGYWLPKEPGKMFECSREFTYDAFQTRCRRDRTPDAVKVKHNSSNSFKKGSLALLAFLFIFIPLFELLYI